MSKSAKSGTPATKEPEASVERRSGKRQVCRGFAEVVQEDAPFLFRGTILELSPSGCYLESSARLMLDPGASVELKFSMNQQELLIPARIVAIRPGEGAGFEFFDVELDLQARLAKLLGKLDPSTERAGARRLVTASVENSPAAPADDQ